MRGTDERSGGLFSYVSLEARIPETHPLRAIRVLIDEALQGLSGEFEALYARTGRPSVPPERLIRALLLQVLYTVRSERQLMEQLDYNLLFRWFVGLGVDDRVWDATTFSKNRDRLLEGGIAQGLFAAVVERARIEDLLSPDHFTVDGTMIEAWAGQKSFVPRDRRERNRAKRERRKQRRRRSGGGEGGRNRAVDFHGERRSNQTHASTTDPDARLARSAGKEARLAYRGHLLTENRNGLVVEARLTQATGTAEREAALEMVQEGARARATLGADRGYDTSEFVAALRSLQVTPHVAQHRSNRRSAIDGRTVRHPGYALSQRARKRVEEVFGWMKTIGGLRKTRHRGRPKVGWSFVFTAMAYNLVRMRTLLASGS